MDEMLHGVSPFGDGDMIAYFGGVVKGEGKFGFIVPINPNLKVRSKSEK